MDFLQQHVADIVVLIAGAGVLVWRVGRLEKSIKEFQATFVPREVFNLTIELLKTQIEAAKSSIKEHK